MPHSNINRVVMTGNLTQDPQLATLPSGTQVCELRVACNGIRRGGDGDWEEKPNFFDVAVFGPQVDSVARYLVKGRGVALDGRLDWREWMTEEGQRRQAVRIIADNVQFLSSGRDGRRETDEAPLAAVGAAEEGDDPEDLSF
jgi:single-strand DNA-binding protein